MQAGKYHGDVQEKYQVARHAPQPSISYVNIFGRFLQISIENKEVCDLLCMYMPSIGLPIEPQKAIRKTHTKSDL